MASSITVRKSIPADAVPMAEIDTLGFQDSALRKAMFPEDRRINPGTQDQIEFFTKLMTSGISNPSLQYVSAVETGADGTEKVVGFAIWQPPKTPSKEEAAQKIPEDTGEHSSGGRENKAGGLEIPSCVDQNVPKTVNEGIAKLLEIAKPSFRGQEKEQLWCLNAISVDPNQRRKGIGRKLAQWGVDQAAAAEQDIWLVATDDGKHLYESMGFKLICEKHDNKDSDYLMMKMHDD